MDILEFFKTLRTEWSTVTTHPEAFIAVLASGLLLGWTAAWLILKQRLTHHRELIDHYKDVLTDKAPALVSSGQGLALRRFGSLGFLILGLLAISATFLLATVISQYQQKINGTSKIQISRLEIRDSEEPVSFNIYMQNTGNIPAIGMIHSDTMKIRDKEITDTELDSAFDLMKSQTKKLDDGKIDSETQPSELIWYTFPYSVTKEQYNQITGGQNFLYILSSFKYRDAGASNGKSWITEVCFYTFKGQAYHRCTRHNRIYATD